MFSKLGRFTAAHPWLICLSWLAAAIAVGILAPAWDERAADDDIRFLPARCDSVKGYRLLEQAFPQDVFASRLIVAVERADAALTPADFALVDDLVAGLNRLRQDEPALQIARICSHRDPFLGKRLVSTDGRCTLIQVSLGTPYLAVQTRTTVDAAERCIRGRLAEAGSDIPAVHVTGPAGIGRDLIAASANSLESTTLATIVLVVVILLLVHRAPLMALIPLGTIAVSVWVALKILALCTLIPGFCVVNISQIFAVVMLYGAGTDYCLFLISRYREELARGHERSTALARSISEVGGALAASAATVICGLGLMGLAEFAKVRCGGPAIAISLAVALVASLTLAPALLRLLGPIAFWPTRPPGDYGLRLANYGLKNESVSEGVWGSISRLVVARPLLIWATAVLTLLPLAVVGFGVEPNYRATAELSPTSGSVQGLAAIQRHFTAGEVGPITVLLESSTDWESPRGQSIVGHLSQGFALLDNVAEVRSLTQPLGSPVTMPAPPATPNLKGTLFRTVWNNVCQGLSDQINRTAAEFYVSRVPPSPPTPLPRFGGEGSNSSPLSPPGGRGVGGEGAVQSSRFVTRLDVVPRTDPFDPQTIATLDLIQMWLREQLPKYPGAEDVRAECHGITVSARDLARVTESDRLRISTLVLASIFLILLVLVRRPWLAVYLLVTVLFSYYASLGATTLLAHWWNGRPLGLVDWRVPFFLFTILVAVGEDYNILLISRMLEERKRYGTVEGTRRALARTGGTITSCGLIMAGTFATLMLGGLSTLVQIGFALAFGVLLDTFVVRPFLVPAFTLLTGGNERGRSVRVRLRRNPFPPPIHRNRAA
jgi:RND superfamily putative drug exporter